MAVNSNMTGHLSKLWMMFFLMTVLMTGEYS